MPHVTLTNDQVIALVRQLPPEQKRTVLLTLAQEAQARGVEQMDYAEARLRAIAATRGVGWDALDEDAREQLIDELLHERP